MGPMTTPFQPSSGAGSIGLASYGLSAAPDVSLPFALPSGVARGNLDMDHDVVIGIDSHKAS
ncbi:hypothetical protein SAMN05421678_12371 [Actinopolymorpha cephalotaxi]|uniref:Uncharacterized protein n=1 Tax=Actinopolymorpha cephalotaxi TaxID=504797 RepID=A0A1I3BDD6_9ACTN|nr:hypothetical protein [Actinopolymorpha cephalotaxi]SFH60160.1 hypothetical protein SAMN05421678_12371 [Actinopolymorpha cephalotaxi]